jgi:hypothetical protein
MNENINAVIKWYSDEKNLAEMNETTHNTLKIWEISVASNYFCPNIKILDLEGSDYTSVYPERLAGVMLGDNSIYYSELNESGQITQLILNDVTGDMNSYGIFTGITATGPDKMNYAYMIGSKTASLTTSSLAGFGTDIGPKGFIFENNVLTGAYALYEADVTSFGSAAIQSGNYKYPLAENCSVYLLTDGKYVPATLDKISDPAKFSVKAYYDKPTISGGRVRVIVAVSKQ